MTSLADRVCLCSLRKGKDRTVVDSGFVCLLPTATARGSAGGMIDVGGRKGEHITRGGGLLFPPSYFVGSVRKETHSLVSRKRDSSVWPMPVTSSPTDPHPPCVSQ